MAGPRLARLARLARRTQKRLQAGHEPSEFSTLFFSGSNLITAVTVAAAYRDVVAVNWVAFLRVQDPLRTRDRTVLPGSPRGRLEATGRGVPRCWCNPPRVCVRATVRVWYSPVQSSPVRNSGVQKNGSAVACWKSGSSYVGIACCCCMMQGTVDGLLSPEQWARNKDIRPTSIGTRKRRRSAPGFYIVNCHVAHATEIGGFQLDASPAPQAPSNRFRSRNATYSACLDYWLGLAGMPTGYGICKVQANSRASDLPM